MTGPARLKRCQKWYGLRGLHDNRCDQEPVHVQMRDPEVVVDLEHAIDVDECQDEARVRTTPLFGCR